MKISIFSGNENQTYNNNITQKYTKQSSEYYEELNKSGMKLFSKSELDTMQNNFQTQVETVF